MSKERIQIAPEFYDIMPREYQDLVNRATYGNENRGWKDIGTSKELVEGWSRLWPGLGSRFVLAVWSLAWGTHIAAVASLIPVLARAEPAKENH